MRAMVILGLVLLGGCGRDAASEAPVTLTPGMYQLHIPRLLAGKASNNDRQSCYAGGADETFIGLVTLELARKAPGCVVADYQRVGNLVTAGARCVQDNGGEMGIAIAATVDPTAVNATYKLDLSKVKGKPEEVARARLLMAMTDLKLSATRVGDC